MMLMMPTMASILQSLAGILPLCFFILVHGKKKMFSYHFSNK